MTKNYKNMGHLFYYVTKTTKDIWRDEESNEVISGKDNLNLGSIHQKELK